MQDLIVIGSGEHARVLMEMAAPQFNLIGYTDGQINIGTNAKLNEVPGVKWLGTDDAISDYPNAQLILGVGNRRVDGRRKAIVEKVGSDRWAVLIHERAHVAPSARIKPGTVVLAGAVVNTLATIGAHAIINTGAIIEHDVVLGDFAHAGPGSTIGGGAIIGAGCFLGIGACVRDHVHIARDNLVAMGAVVVADCHEYGIELRGAPARSYGR